MAAASPQCPWLIEGGRDGDQVSYDQKARLTDVVPQTPMNAVLS